MYNRTGIQENTILKGRNLTSVPSIHLFIQMEGHGLHKPHQSLHRQGEKGEFNLYVLKSIFYILPKNTMHYVCYVTHG